MLDYPTTAFFSPTARTAAGWILGVLTIWLLVRLNWPNAEFDHHSINASLRELVARSPPDPTPEHPPYWTIARIRLAQHWLTLDCLFAFVYPALCSVFCGWLSQHSRHPLVANAGAALSWLVLVTTMVDLGENAAITGLLTAPHHALARHMAQGLGIAKWVLPGLAGLYAAGWLVLHRLRQPVSD